MMRDALNQRRQQNRQHQGPQQRRLMLADHVVDQEFRRIGQNESGDLVDDHQYEAQCEQSAARTHQLPDLRPNRLQALDLRGLHDFDGWRAQSIV
jgi:hypothetical protein